MNQGSAIVHLGRVAAAVSLSTGVLGFAILHSGEPTGSAVVHVGVPDVLISIDDQTIAVEGYRTRPVVQELSPGPHTLRTTVKGIVKQVVSFRIIAGEDTVLSAWFPDDQEVPRPIIVISPWDPHRLPTKFDRLD